VPVDNGLISGQFNRGILASNLNHRQLESVMQVTNSCQGKCVIQEMAAQNHRWHRSLTTPAFVAFIQGRKFSRKSCTGIDHTNTAKHHRSTPTGVQHPIFRLTRLVLASASCAVVSAHITALIAPSSNALPEECEIDLSRFSLGDRVVLTSEYVEFVRYGISVRTDSNMFNSLVV
jgi:hypothetical protein